jgi:hypothetical protein
MKDGSSGEGNRTSPARAIPDRSVCCWEASRWQRQRRHGRTRKAGKKQPVARDSQLIGRSRETWPTGIQEQAAVLIKRIPSKEPPKRRHAQAPMKQWTALTSDVPQRPVVVAAKSRLAPAEAENGTASPTSAFGVTITRRLASL